MSNDVFSSSESLLSILKILQCFAIERHEWKVSPDGIAVAEEYLKENAPKLASTYAQLGEKAMVGAAWNVGGGARTIVISKPDLDRAVDDLYRSAILVVENATSDGHFIRAIATALQATRVTHALDKGWLTIRQAGGSGQLKVTAENESKIFNLHVRVVALFDSDSMVPDHETQNHKDAKALESIGIVAHVLRLREAENYVPNRVLTSSGKWSKTSAKLDCFKEFSPEQRGYFDMKKGFAKDKHGPIVHVAQKELYGDVKSAALRSLCGGFGPELLRLLAEQADAMTPDDFGRMGVKHELHDLLSKIEAVI